MGILIFKRSFLLISLILMISCNRNPNSGFPTPIIKEGMAKVSGKISGSIIGSGKYAYMNVPYPISCERVKFESLIDENGVFEFEVPVETVISFAIINIDINPDTYLTVDLNSGKETKIEITYNAENIIVSIASNSLMKQNDILYGSQALSNLLEYRSGAPREKLYEKDPSYFLSHAAKVVSSRIELVLDTDTLVSEEYKKIVAEDFKLCMYETHVFDYEGEMNFNHMGLNNNKPINHEQIKKIDRSYFYFLRECNLNDHSYLYCSFFSVFQEKILDNDILNIPDIGDTSIDEWLSEVKLILADLVGFDKGLYYDVLVANAYAKQFNDLNKPLSDKQVDNIKSYFKGGEIAKILFRRDEEVKTLHKESIPLVINQTPDVPKEELMNAIISKYKGEVVMVDLWATWCGPCVDAMKEIEKIKSELSSKGVKFVYITNGSSPQRLWSEKIKGIGSEHYYLNDQQWQYVMEEHNFQGIPSYIIYNREGKEHYKTTSYPGNEEIKKQIEEII